MRDKKLLKDVLLYLKSQNQELTFGRLRKSLIRRLNAEIYLDPDEMTRLCGTFIHLFENPRSDCQPSRAWELLADKMRVALSKSKKVEKETDPVASASVEILALMEESAKKIRDSLNSSYDVENLGEAFAEYVEYYKSSHKGVHDVSQE